MGHSHVFIALDFVPFVAAAVCLFSRSHTVTMPGSVSPLPTDSRVPYQLPSGTVRLLKHTDWHSPQWDLRYNGDDTNTANCEYNIIGTWMNDQASWAAFNLPVGVVVTLTEHPVPRSSTPLPGCVNNCANLVGCGKVVDLVGTGRTEGVNLITLGFNDTMSAWFWRKVDLSLGAVELYEHPNFTGSRTVIFLSDWHPGTIHDISGWYMNDVASSAKWHTLDDRVTCTVWEHIGSGTQKILAGYNGVREISFLGTQNMDDKISSFKWNVLLPKKEVIKPFNIPLTLDMSESRTFTASGVHKNDTDEVNEFVVRLDRRDDETMTVTTTDSLREAFDMITQYSLETGASGGLTGETSECEASLTSFSLSMKLSYDYTKTGSRRGSTTTTNSWVSLAMPFKAGPWKTTVGTLTARVATVPCTSFETRARRWYETQVAGSTRDPHTPGWYMRDETVKGHVEGALRAEVESHSYYQ